jgi:hypothetical protein
VIRDIAPYMLRNEKLSILIRPERFDNMGAKKDYLPATYYE